MEYAKILQCLYTKNKDTRGGESMIAQVLRNNFKDIDVAEDIELQESDIVENPDEVIVQFPIVSDIKLDEKLPFFKSIMVKFASL